MSDTSTNAPEDQVVDAEFPAPADDPATVDATVPAPPVQDDWDATVPLTEAEGLVITEATTTDSEGSIVDITQEVQDQGSPVITESTAPSARTPLWQDVKEVLDRYVQGDVQLAEGKLLTPGAIAAEIGVKRGGKAPSTGAVNSLMTRWVEFGYITMTSKPVAFEDFTQAGRDIGLKALKDAHRDQLKVARAANKQIEDATSGLANPPEDTVQSTDPQGENYQPATPEPQPDHTEPSPEWAQDAQPEPVLPNPVAPDEAPNSPVAPGQVEAPAPSDGSSDPDDDQAPF